MSGREHPVDSLARLKTRLQVVSLLISCLELIILIMTVMGVLIVNPNVALYLHGKLQLDLTNTVVFLLFVSASIVFLIVIGLFYFEMLVKSARILSSEFADEMGWYSEYSSAGERKSGPRKRSTRLAPSSSDFDENRGPMNDSYTNLRARVVLREIVENSYLPLAKTELGPIIYAASALLLFFMQIAVSYATFSALK